VDEEISKIKKLNPFQTYMAILKGYVGVGMLNVSKAFANGGYVASPIFIICSAILTTICAQKLIRIG
jgi:proton-coupled amino acid transporter